MIAFSVPRSTRLSTSTRFFTPPLWAISVVITAETFCSSTRSTSRITSGLVRSMPAIRRATSTWISGGRPEITGAASSGAPDSPQRRRARPDDVAATLRAALADAGVEPARVGLVHASANGVPWIDAAEEAALSDVFGTAPRVERVKLQAGENPCSGALQLALAARALRDDPSLGAAVVNSLGAGGNQIVAVFTAP